MIRPAGFFLPIINEYAIQRKLIFRYKSTIRAFIKYITYYSYSGRLVFHGVHLYIATCGLRQSLSVPQRWLCFVVDVCVWLPPLRGAVQLTCHL